MVYLHCLILSLCKIKLYSSLPSLSPLRNQTTQTASFSSSVCYLGCWLQSLQIRPRWNLRNFLTPLSSVSTPNLGDSKNNNFVTKCFSNIKNNKEISLLLTDQCALSHTCCLSLISHILPFFFLASPIPSCTHHQSLCQSYLKAFEGSPPLTGLSSCSLMRCVRASVIQCLLYHSLPHTLHFSRTQPVVPSCTFPHSSPLCPNS